MARTELLVSLEALFEIEGLPFNRGHLRTWNDGLQK